MRVIMGFTTGDLTWRGRDARERVALVDALEADVVSAYQRRRALAAVVLDAVRRADATARLDVALRSARSVGSL
jgi:hypothetical protein